MGVTPARMCSFARYWLPSLWRSSGATYNRMPALAQLDCVPFFPRRWWCVGGAWWLLVGGACLERSVMFQAVSELVWPKEVYRVDLEQHMCLELFVSGDETC